MTAGGSPLQNIEPIPVMKNTITKLEDEDINFVACECPIAVWSDVVL